MRGSAIRKARHGSDFGSIHEIDHNYAGFLSNGFVLDYPDLVHDNVVEGIGTSTNASNHENGIEAVSDCNLLMYNNVLKNTTVPGGVIYKQTPETSGCNDYSFNDVWFNDANGNLMNCGNDGTGTCHFFNETIGCGPTGTLNGPLLLNSRPGHNASDQRVLLVHHFIFQLHTASK